MARLLVLLVLFSHIIPVAAQSECTVADAMVVENLTLISAGDALLTDITPAAPDVVLTVTTNARVRSAPVAAGDTNVVNGIDAGVTLNALARNAAGDWFYVYLGAQSQGRAEAGWVSNQVLRVAGDSASLPVIEAGDTIELPPPPMSSWSLAAQSDDPCAALLLQSGDADATTALTFNEVEVMVVGTALLQPLDDGLAVTSLDGRALVSVGDSQALLVAGTTTLAAPESEFVTQSAQPETLELGALISEQAAQAQPVTAVPVVEPVEANAIEALITETFAPNGAFDGTYYFTGYFACTHPQAPNSRSDFEDTIRLTLLPDSINTISDTGQSVSIYTKGGDGRFYSTLNSGYDSGITRDGRQMRTESTAQVTVTLINETTLRSTTSATTRVPLYADGYATGEYGTQNCTGETNYTWVAP